MKQIYSITHLEKYLARHRQTNHLTMVEYFTVYRITKEEDADDVFNCEDRFGFVDRDTINIDEETILDTRIAKLFQSHVQIIMIVVMLGV